MGNQSKKINVAELDELLKDYFKEISSDDIDTENEVKERVFNRIMKKDYNILEKFKNLFGQKLNYIIYFPVILGILSFFTVFTINQNNNITALKAMNAVNNAYIATEAYESDLDLDIDDIDADLQILLEM